MIYGFLLNAAKIIFLIQKECIIDASTVGLHMASASHTLDVSTLGLHMASASHTLDLSTLGLHMASASHTLDVSTLGLHVVSASHIFHNFVMKVRDVLLCSHILNFYRKTGF